jgi:hypothetical protein
VGLLRERAWARPMMLAYWPLIWLVVSAMSIGSGEGLGDAISGLLTLGLCAGVAGMYLYGKANVVAYFDARKAHEARAKRRRDGDVEHGETANQMNVP